MPTALTRRHVLAALLALAVILGMMAVLRVNPTPPLQAQTAPVLVTQFPGASVDFLGKAGETHTLTTACPAGFFAIAGGWEHIGTPSFVVLDSFASQLPGGGGSGIWTLTVRKLDKGPLTIIPTVSCVGGPGVAQLFE